MTKPVAQELDFATLDGLAFAAERGRLNWQLIPHLEAREIGPVLELVQLAEDGVLPALHIAPILAHNGLDRLVQALEGGQRHWVCPVSRNMGLFRTTFALPQKNEMAWIRFGVAAQQAATASGFPKPIAAQLAAALGELYSNIYEHAQATDTGIVVFRTHPGCFEFVVADRGIGILASLRSTITYSKLLDHGEALWLALTEGVSRYGLGTDRGHGFRPLFVGLANLKGDLRFRSGDHALLIDGQHPTLMTGRLAQKACISGFFVSVSCETAVTPVRTNRMVSSPSGRK